MDKRIKSAKPRSAVRSRMRSLSDKLLLAMTIDKACGGPLLNFLRRSVSLHVQCFNRLRFLSVNYMYLIGFSREAEFPQCYSKLLFWQEVTEYSIEEERSADRCDESCIQSIVGA